ncbi:MAG: HdaA/DnaA family protein [Burkholderiales bacterium]
MEQFILELATPQAPTLASFVAGGNAPALQALRLLIDGRPPHRVLYLWGPMGVGRTHLLKSVVDAAAAAGRPAAYFDARTLDVDSLLDARADLVAIDNIDGLAPAGEHAIFEWFTGRSGDAILLAADRPPGSLDAREDVRTRLGSGIVFEIVPLSDADKHAALRAHAMARGLPDLDEVIQYLLARTDRDMGMLIAVIDALDRYSLSTKRPPTLALVRQILRPPPTKTTDGTDPVRPG